MCNAVSADVDRLHIKRHFSGGDVHLVERSEASAAERLRRRDRKILCVLAHTTTLEDICNQYSFRSGGAEIIRLP